MINNQEIEKLTQQITNITTIFGPSITLKSVEFYLKASQKENYVTLVELLILYLITKKRWMN